MNPNTMSVRIQPDEGTFSTVSSSGTSELEETADRVVQISMENAIDPRQIHFF